MSRNERTDEALKAVYRFFERYPPKELRNPPPLEAYDSTRTVLISNKPLVRLIMQHEIGDDTIPPILEFRDVEALHQRLVINDDKKAIRSLNYVLTCYTASLRTRRKNTVLATAPSHPSIVVGSITPPKSK
jgi:hypothetical protein